MAKGSQTRDWVLEHEPRASSKAQWHWFGSGRSAHAACGRAPIAGSPLVYSDNILAENFIVSEICPRCEELFRLRQHELENGT